MGVPLQQILNFLRTWAPEADAESFDNVGLLIGDEKSAIERCILCLDYTEEVLQFALKHKAQLVIMHHPIWFYQRKRLTTHDWTGALLLKTIRQGIHLYAMHTNLDKALPGVNSAIGQRLQLQQTRFIDEEQRIGLWGYLSQPMEKDSFLKWVSQQLKTPFLRYSGNKRRIVSVAVCGGSGSFLLEKVKTLAIDAYITSDIRYHTFFEAQNLLLIDAGHYETEQWVIALLQKQLASQFKNVVFLPVPFSTNPVNYWYGG